MTRWAISAGARPRSIPLRFAERASCLGPGLRSHDAKSELLPATLFALLLIGCLGSTNSTASFSLPKPLAQVLEPCRPTAARGQSDGSANSAGTEGTARDGRFDLRERDNKRQLLIDAWPK